MIDDALIESYIKGFFGYGTFGAPDWFIGMEEGCSDVVGEIGTRVEIWQSRGSKELDDLFHYHVAIKRDEFFSQHPKLQSTWKKLIRIVLNVRGETDENLNVKKYQSDRLGRDNCETCLLELMPLPSKKMSEWLYPEISSIPYLQTRKKYEAHVSPIRINALKKKIADHSPSVVVFYGKPYEEYWNMVSDSELNSVDLTGTKVAEKNGTLFVSISHPLLLTNSFLQDLGAFIRRRLVGSHSY